MTIESKTTGTNLDLKHGEILIIGFPNGNNLQVAVFKNSEFNYLVKRNDEDIIIWNYISKKIRSLGAVIDAKSIGEEEVILPNNPQYSKYDEFLKEVWV